MAKLRVNGSAGPDTVNLGDFEYRLVSPYDGFEMFAGDGNDKITGSKLHDILHGGAGDDTLDGGNGNDTVSYQGELNYVDVDLKAGIGKVFPGLTLGFVTPEIDTLVSIENATAGDGGSRLSGNDQSNVLTGGAGRDLLIGLGGNDGLIGGANVDTASYAYAGQNFVDVNLLAGTAKVVSPANLVLEQDKLSEIENVIAGNGGSRMIGDAADNEFTGGNGKDDLRGGVGNDRLIGGANDDTLDGGFNDDTLFGGAGNDTMIGGDGKDTASYADETFFVKVDLVAGTGKVVSPSNLVVQQDTLSGIENVTAGSGGSYLKGDGNDNVLTGGAGRDEMYGQGGYDMLIGGAHDDYLDGGTEDDTFFGGAGNDTIIGGTGVDTVSYAGQFGFVDLTLGGYWSQIGTGRLLVGGIEVERDDLSGIENATAGDFGSTMNGSIFHNVFTGGAGQDTLRGNRGDDTLIGGDGDDTLEGGLHSDILQGGAGNDTIDGGDGIDTVSYAGESSYVHVDLNAEFATVDRNPNNTFLIDEEDEIVGVENVTAGDGGSTVYASSVDNVLTGGAGMDTFWGYGGADTMNGNAGEDFLFGMEQDDVLDGGSENDFLDGGAGSDTLTGGSGADRFQYNISWNGVLIDGVDTIKDFDATSPEHDVIYLWDQSGDSVLHGMTAQQALDGGYIARVAYGTAGQGEFGTTIMFDRNGGVHLPGDLVALATLENVEATSLTAQNFFIA